MDNNTFCLSMRTNMSSLKLLLRNLTPDQIKQLNIKWEWASVNDEYYKIIDKPNSRIIVFVMCYWNENRKYETDLELGEFLDKNEWEFFNNTINEVMV